MIENGAIYTLTGPDGTQAVLNDATHPDAIGWLRDLSGFDSPEVRLEVAPMGQRDGAYLAGPGFYGARQITLDGILIPGTAYSVNQREAALRRATDALRADSTLTWWPEGYPEMQIKVRRAQPLRVRPGRPREFQLALVATDPRIYSAEQVTRFTTKEEVPSLEINNTTYVGPIVRAGNSGSAYAPCTLIVTGPVTSPVVRLIETGEVLSFPGLNVPAGQYLEIDTAEQTVKLNGSQNAYGFLDWPNSAFFFLPPESAPHVQLTGGSTGNATGIRVTYRHAWM